MALKCQIRILGGFHTERILFIDLFKSGTQGEVLDHLPDFHRIFSQLGVDFLWLILRPHGLMYWIEINIYNLWSERKFLKSKIR